MTMLLGTVQDADIQESEAWGNGNMPTARGTQLRGSVGAPEGEKSVEKDFWSSGGLALSHKGRMGGGQGYTRQKERQV